MPEENEILINTDALSKVNDSVHILKDKLSEVLKNIESCNSEFVSTSDGKFAQAFSTNAKQFEESLRAHIELLNDVSEYATTTLEQQIELDQSIAQSME